MGAKNITTTKNYRLFKISQENRPLKLTGRETLRRSMKEYGFLRSFPISCCRNGDAHLVVKDGQNRLAIAEELGLPVHYIVDDVDFDIAQVNNAQKAWTTADYAGKYAAQGNKHYAEGIEFAESHGLPIAKAFSLLAGFTSFSGISKPFRSGQFVVANRDFADQVASAYVAISNLSSNVKNESFLAALMAACRVDGFDTGRLLSGAKKCVDKLHSYSTREAYLEMIEEIYNFNRQNLMPVKIPAMKELRDRNPVKK